MSVLNIAHRGARSLAPENTLLAAEKGLALGADLWELDVAVTLDGELVVLHDDTLERTSNVAAVFPERRPWSVWTFALAELRQLDFGSWYAEKDPFSQVRAGAVSAGELARFKGAPIPTLREALEFTRSHQWRVNIEIKDAAHTPGDAFVVEKVAGLVKELDMLDRVILSSFNHDYIKRVKTADADIVTAALVDQPAPDPVALLEKTGAQAYNPNGKFLDEKTVRAVRAAGYDVLVWTVNEEADLRVLMEWGVSGIFTDFPQRLNRLLGR
ncbi:glycerophosphoryl diester phosphodiesterase [Longilinea arvoryzae]|uniref:Glycerophosphoryl diester phosphodiesterase n=1 Tax=Longilinea arvoryzae TaxID=360412 RepID=A0A0S7B848_9CHLR|nr:glycerophosphodiester phosphodiesterase family protein [Longilinea arvoryzae]GAP13511.1 glycerophosphoryl diester phosphodiesterase [Longilinea arvoryzae]